MYLEQMYCTHPPPMFDCNLNGMLPRKIIKLLTKEYQDTCLDIGKDMKLDR